MRRTSIGGSPRAQRGGFVLGLIVGLLVGLALSLGVALYVTKVPVPFINKVPQRSAEQDAAQAEKNRNWDPNGPLAGRGATRAPSAASAASTPALATPSPAAGPARQGKTADGAVATKKDAKAAAAAAEKPASAPDPFTYFVQAGAYARAEDAEQQRASLALTGLAAKITEREQAGRTVYRVRVGPYERKDEADAAREKLAAAGIDSALVRVQR
jgi:cell division protein FtsN